MTGWRVSTTTPPDAGTSTPHLPRDRGVMMRPFRFLADAWRAPTTSERLRADVGVDSDVTIEKLRGWIRAAKELDDGLVHKERCDHCGRFTNTKVATLWRLLCDPVVVAALNDDEPPIGEGITMDELRARFGR